MSQLMIKLETQSLLHDFYGLQIICFAFDEWLKGIGKDLGLGLTTFLWSKVSNLFKLFNLSSMLYVFYDFYVI